ncbi:MAG: extracellular solute-binding protein [Candidatus Pacebacteria bacterium]|nr:extracellular solute-binding protein [Candidatus Paceibacterota bacterium]MDD5356701.1 extracellular solute-binding protein [Candidatus Paceibacterota bacterium]
MSNFQIVFIGILIFFAIVGLITFAIVRAPEGSATASVVIWGTVPQQTFDALFTALNQGKQSELKVSYVEKDEATFDTDLAEAIATGHGPDIFLLGQDKIYRHSEKIALIPFTALTQRQFQDTFIQEGNMYLTGNGILALPFVIDPLVMYWNRDLLTNASVVAPPKNWSDFIAFTKKLTLKNNASVLLQSAGAMGEFKNVSNAKEILATLLLQSGNPITKYDQIGWVSALDSSGNSAEEGLRFYAQFGNPTNEAYTWNRSLPLSIDSFASGKLAVYFGFASELKTLRQKNPNLNLDMALMPQPKEVTVSMTFGRMYGLAILKTSPNFVSALNMITYLTSQDVVRNFAVVSGLPPTRLDLLAVPPQDSLSPVMYSSALRSRAWFDPNPTETKNIFQRMIETVSSGQEKYSDAIGLGSQAIQLLFNQNN